MQPASAAAETIAPQNNVPGYDFTALGILRDHITAQDVAAVEAMFQTVRADSRKSRADQRDLFAVFEQLHPDTDTFTKAWVAAQPASAPAMVARGTYLKALGWAYRGNAYANDAYPERLTAFRAAHLEGLALMEHARDAAPDLLAASDGVIAMSYTTGNQSAVIPEVRRIMAIAPNRATLLKAATALAPQWGGSTADILAMCNLFADAVTDQPGYDDRICLIDGLMSANLGPGFQRDQALSMLANSDSPLLDFWREEHVVGETPSDRIANLQRIKASRALTTFEARLYDQDAQTLAVLTGTPLPAELPAAVTEAMTRTKWWVDVSPGNPVMVADYFNAIQDGSTVNGIRFDSAELRRIFSSHLKIARYTPWVWLELALNEAYSATDELTGIEVAQPYMINAIAYSNHGQDALVQAFRMKFPLVFSALANAQPPADVKRFHRVVQCPMVRELRLLLARCETEGLDFETCTNGLPYQASNMEGLVNDIRQAGVCKAETETDLTDLFYTPVPVEFP